MLLLRVSGLRLSAILENGANGRDGQSEEVFRLSHAFAARHETDDVHLLRNVKTDSRLDLLERWIRVDMSVPCNSARTIMP